MGLAIHKFKSFPYPLQIIILASMYFVLGRVGLLFSGTHYSVSMVWPPSGIAIAAFLLFGYQLWPGIILGAFLVNLANGMPPAGAAIISLGNTLEGMAGVYILLRYLHVLPSLRRVYDIMCFVLVGGLIATAIGATIGSFALWVSGVMELSNYAAIWGTWWVGDLMGVLIVAPVLLTWSNTENLKLKWALMTEFLLLLGILVVISVLVFATPLATAGFYPLAYLTFLFLIWAAFRFGLRTVALSNLLIWIIAAWGTTQHIGPFIRSDMQESLIFVCSFVGTISITGLLLAAAIGERKQSETSLKENEALLQAVMANLPFEVWVRDLDDRCVMQNPASVALWGDIIGKGLEDLGLDADTLPVWQENNRRTLAGEAQHSETEVTIRGQKHYFYSVAAPIRSGGTMRGIVGTNIDVTEQKLAEIALRKSEERFSQAFRANPAALNISTLDDGTLIDVNPGFLEFSGFTRDEVIGHTAEALNMVVGESARERLAAFLLEHGKAPLREGDIRIKSGEIRHVQYSAEIMDIEGKPHVLGSFTDITEKQQAEIALRDSEARFRAIFEGASLGIAVFEPGGTAISVNPALQRILGYSEAELAGVRFRNITYPDDVRPTVDLFQRLQKGEIDHYQIDKRYIHKQGGIVWTQISVAALGPSDGQGVMAVALIDDITEWKLADEAVRDSEARFRAIFEGASIGIAVVDETGGLVSANPAFAQMLCYEAHELLGKRFQDFTHRDDLGKNLELFQQLKSGQIDHYQYEKRYIRKDGELVWVRMNVSSFPNREHRLAVALVEDITQAKQAEAALRQSEAHNKALLDSMPDMMFLLDKNGVFLDYRAPSGAALFVPPEVFMGNRIYDVLPDTLTSTMQSRIKRAFETGAMQFFEYSTPYSDNPNMYESRIVAFDEDKVLVISRDITERKRAEVAIRELNADLERRVTERTAELAAANERLTELDRLKSKFIADVSHELRTPLAVLNTRVYLLENGLPEKRAEYLTGLRGQIERLTHFVNTVLDLSRLDLGKGKIEFEAVNLNEVVDQVTAALAPRAEVSGLRLNVHCAKRLPSMQGEFNQLAQVATNLIANAINYTANGHIDVSTGIEDGYIYLRVEDTGMGIAPDDIPHLFERFYRGERAGETKIAGSGLGLSIVKEIVDLHNGDIHVESQVGKGTIFTVTLPAGNTQETFGFAQ